MMKQLRIIALVLALLLVSTAHAQDATTTPAALNTNLQVLHMAPDAPPVDIYMNGALAIAELAYGTTSGYVTVAAGEYQVVITAAGSNPDAAVLGPLPLTLTPGNFLSIAAVGSLSEETLRLTLFTQSFPILPETENGATVLHAIEGGPAVDVVADGGVAAAGVAYPGTQGTNDGAINLSIPNPATTLTVNASGSSTVLFDLSALEQTPATYYLLVAGGTVAAPELFVFTTTAADFAALDDALYTALPDEAEMLPNIAELVAAQAEADPAEFTILLAALQNAEPEVLEVLQGTDDVTVFAPTDEAFTNLLATLGLTADELLEQPLLSDILRYHVLPGNFTAAAVVALDGDFAPTALADNFVAVTVTDAGAVLLNDIVTVVETDVAASNGVVHVIDEVLLPNVALEAFGLVANSYVQVLHAAPDAPPVDIYVDGAVAINALTYGNTSGYVALPAGDYEVAVAPAGTSLADAVLGPLPLTLNPESALSLAAVGSVEAGTLRATLFTQSFPLLPDSEVAVTVLHTIVDGPPVDVVVDGQVIAMGLAYPGTDGTNDGAINISVPLGFTTLTVNAAASEAVILDLSAVELQAGTYYVLLASGTVDAPTQFLLAYDADPRN